MSMFAAFMGSRTASYIGGVVANNVLTTYPAGTQAGDLVIAVLHATTPGTPAGYTSAFITAADANGYKKRVCYKIVAADTNVDLTSAGSGFDSHVITIRGRTSVSASNVWGYATAGATVGQTVPVSGTAITIASDRGAASLPGVSPTPSASLSGTAGYFKSTTGIYLSAASGATLSFTDISDSLGTSGLLFVAI